MSDRVDVLPNFASRTVQHQDSNPNGGVDKASTSSDMRRGGLPGAPAEVTVVHTTDYNGYMGRGDAAKQTVTPRP